ncbi:head-tail connector protein [Glaciimonas sp. PAMC28666]|uniref:head-tail connector protein n=1 Tax=Glaciimonas sp. PAMC28666 TaxID=2807626 RepID=UPI0019667B9F|nr:head-tail connector protein [Glaciimonas sp. PAMC28666]QRX82247.1 phage gp6-like head-tail connector protein [Glaciimonas sp. PAMC28666]
MLITDAQARLHLKLDDPDEDISLAVQAAELSAQAFMNRNVYADQSALDAAVLAGIAGPSPMVINALIQAGMLLILGHLYANREDVVVGASVSEVPHGSHALLMPYRAQLGV